MSSGLTDTTVTSVAVLTSNLFAGTWGGGVFRSTDNGESWSSANNGLMGTFVYALVDSGTNLFAGTNDRGVFRSSNNGTSWTQVNSGLSDSTVMSLAVSGTNLFAGTWGGGVWRRPLSEMITSVQHKSEIPFHFRLEQNYPNPFNPSTIIKFAITSNQFVQLKIYDVLGREVASLVNEEKPSGSYEINFNAAQLSSGIYFYKMQAGSFVQIKKMILLK